MLIDGPQPKTSKTCTSASFFYIAGDDNAKPSHQQNMAQGHYITDNEYIVVLLQKGNIIKSFKILYNK